MTAARRYTLDCPQSADHGGLYDWPGERTAWFCPNVRHTGTPFYDSELNPVRRTLPDALTGTVAPRRARSGAGGHRTPDAAASPATRTAAQAIPSTGAVDVRASASAPTGESALAPSSGSPALAFPGPSATPATSGHESRTAANPAAGLSPRAGGGDPLSLGLLP